MGGEFETIAVAVNACLQFKCGVGVSDAIRPRSILADSFFLGGRGAIAYKHV